MAFSVILWPLSSLYGSKKPGRAKLEKIRATNKSNLIQEKRKNRFSANFQHPIHLKMAYQGQQKVQKVMVQPINLIFRFLQNRTRVQVWLYENVNTRIEGHIVGFDEYMNLVLDDAAEVHLKRGTMKKVGRIMLKGDNITLIQSMDGKNSGATGAMTA